MKSYKHDGPYEAKEITETRVSDSEARDSVCREMFACGYSKANPIQKSVVDGRFEQLRVVEEYKPVPLTTPVSGGVMAGADGNHALSTPCSDAPMELPPLEVCPIEIRHGYPECDCDLVGEPPCGKMPSHEEVLTKYSPLAQRECQLRTALSTIAEKDREIIQWEAEVRAVIDNLPDETVIVVREGAGQANIAASLAVTVANLNRHAEVAEAELAKLKETPKEFDEWWITTRPFLDHMPSDLTGIARSAWTAALRGRTEEK